MSSLRRDRDGIWFLDLSIPGKRYRLSLKTRDYREAKSRRRSYERQIGAPQIEQHVSLEDFERECFEYSTSRKSPKTAEKEKYSLKLLAQHYRIRDLSDLTRRHADDFITALSKGKLAPASINSYLAALRAVFSLAVRWGYITENPFKGVQRVIEVEEPVRILTLREIRAIFEKARELVPDLYPLFVFYLFTGCRRSEALRLEWTDINAERGTITFRSTKSTIRRRKRMREMIISPIIYRVLEARKGFPKPFEFKEHYVSDKFRQIVAKAKVDEKPIEGIHLHNLRMTFSSYSQDVGMPRGFVSWLIGHADEQVTQGQYTGFYAEMIHSYLGKLEAKLLPQLPSDPLQSSAD